MQTLGLGKQKCQYLNPDAEKIMANQCILVSGVIDFCVSELVLTDTGIELVTELFAAETFLFVYERFFFLFSETFIFTSKISLIYLKNIFSLIYRFILFLVLLLFDSSIFFFELFHQPTKSYRQNHSSKAQNILSYGMKLHNEKPSTKSF